MEGRPAKLPTSIILSIFKCRCLILGHMCLVTCVVLYLGTCHLCSMEPCRDKALLLRVKRYVQNNHGLLHSVICICSSISSKPLVKTACTHTPLHPCIHAPMQFYIHESRKVCKAGPWSPLGGPTGGSWRLWRASWGLWDGSWEALGRLLAGSWRLPRGILNESPWEPKFRDDFCQNLKFWGAILAKF